MPSVYNYRHVELDKVGRGKRAIQPPGGQTADIFGRAGLEGNFSSASSQAGSDVASSRVHIETDQQSIGSSGAHDGIIRQPQAPSTGSEGQMSPTSSLGSNSLASGGNSPQQAPQQAAAAGASGEQQLLLAHSFKAESSLSGAPGTPDARTPKKTIPVLRRNPITGEILGAPSQPAVLRVRQPPGGRSSGIF